MVKLQGCLDFYSLITWELIQFDSCCTWFGFQIVLCHLFPVLWKRWRFQNQALFCSQVANFINNHLQIYSQNVGLGKKWLRLWILLISNEIIQPVIHTLIYDILLYCYVLYIIEMKSFFNHWRLSISPGSVGKINSHQQPFESRFVPDSEVQADFEEPIVADRWKANHFLECSGLLWINKPKNSMVLVHLPTWMVNFYANCIHAYLYIYIYKYLWENAGNFFPGWGWDFRWWSKKVLFVEFFMIPNLTCADVSNGWKQR